MLKAKYSRIWWAFALCALLAGATAYAAGEKAAKTAHEGAAAAHAAVLTGTLIDSKCYAADHNNTGNDHGDMKNCGTICANSGIPVGLLVDGKKDGRVVILLVSSKALADYVGQTAQVTGGKMLGHDAVVPEKIAVKQADGTFKEVSLSAM